MYKPQYQTIPQVSRFFLPPIYSGAEWPTNSWELMHIHIESSWEIISSMCHLTVWLIMPCWPVLQVELSFRHKILRVAVSLTNVSLGNFCPISIISTLSIMCLVSHGEPAPIRFSSEPDLTISFNPSISISTLFIRMMAALLPFSPQWAVPLTGGSDSGAELAKVVPGPPSIMMFWV